MPPIPKGGIPDRLATLTTRSPKPKLTIQTSFDAYTTSGDTSTPSLTDLSSATSSSASSPSVATDNDDLTVVRTIATHPATTPTPNTASFFKRKPEMKVTGDTELLGEEDWDIDIDDGRWKKRMGCKPRKKSPAGGMDEDW
ncbi:hypothetical protein NMY22_g3632 [Coprinellus aureogranulatus]|nr:hypothetical protein NMY22_g3632 [Coprinellus aureogranulatus]